MCKQCQRHVHNGMKHARDSDQQFNIQLEKEHPITYVKTAYSNNSYRILAVKSIGNAPLEDREGDGRIMLKWVLWNA